jgi:hypothetical protein
MLDSRTARVSHRIASGLVAFGAAAVASGFVSTSAAPPPLDEALATSIVEEVVGDVERLRGLEFTRAVPVRVIDDAAARERMLERVRRLGYLELLEVQETAYTLLGLLPPRTDLLGTMLAALEEQAGGFYDPEDGTFYLLSDMPSEAASVLVVHELTHAIEDQHYDLDSRLVKDLDNEDRLFATAAVHEGSATVVMMAFTAQAMISGKLSAEDLQAMAQTEAARGEVFRKLPPVLQRQLLGPYVLGASFLAQGNLLAAAMGVPPERLAGVYADGPVSSEQILHPQRYWERRDDPRPVVLDGAGELLGDGWQRSGGGSLGEVTLGVLVGAPTPPIEQAAMTGPEAWTNGAADGWGGDRWELWSRRNKKKHVVLLSTVWDSSEDAEQFARALPGGLTFERRGDRVAIVAGKAGGKAASLLKRMLAP